MSTGEGLGTRLSYVLSEFDARLAAMVDGPTVIDRIRLPDAGTSPGQHKLVSVEATTTSNSEQYRDRGLARVVDEVRVSLAYRVRPNAQKVARGEALDLEEQIREWLTTPSWHADWHVAYEGSTRRAGSTAAEWWLSEQTFRVTRDAELGG